MKKISKLLSLFLALCMLFSVSAFASGEPSGEASGDASAEAASAPVAPKTKNTSDVSSMKPSDYATLTNYTNRDDTGNIYVGHDVSASEEIVLDDTVTGAGYSSVVASGEMAQADITGTLVLTDDSSGEMASDFNGQGSAFVAYGGAQMNIEDATVYTDGFERTGIIVSQQANVMVKNSDFTVLGANPLTEAYDGYVNSANQNIMLSPPWPLGIMGGARVVNMIGTTPTLTILDSTLTSGGWALLSTDSGSNMVINVVDTEMSFLPESEGGMDSGWRIFGYDEDAYGSGYGSYYIGNPSQYYYGATFDGVTYAAIITGAETGHYASSNGSIDLFDANGEKIETVKGKGQPTVINGVFGFMMHNAISDGIYIEDGTIVNTEESTVIYKSANGDFFFDNAELNPKNGVIIQMIDNDDDSRIGMISMVEGFATDYDEAKVNAGDGFPGINYKYESAGEGNTLSTTFTNGEYEGNLYNGTGYYNQKGDDLNVTIGEGATLTGDIALTSTIKGLKYSPEAIEGIKHYGDNIGYILLDADGNVAKSEKDAAYIQIQSYTIDEYFLQGHVENKLHYNGASTINVLVTDGGVWNVAEESLIANLTVEAGAKVMGELTVNKDGTLTLTPSTKELAPGVYGTIEATGSGESVGGGVTGDGTLDVEAAAAATNNDSNASGEPAGASAEPMASANDNAATAVLIATSLSAGASGEPSVEPSADPSDEADKTVIIIGGKQYVLDVYTIDGEEYVKLSDLAALFDDKAEADDGDVTWADYQEYLIEAAGGNAPDLDEFKGQVYAIESWDDMPLDQSPWDQLFTTVGISTWADFVAAGGNGAASQVEGAMA